MQLSAFATGSVTLAWNACTDPNVAGYNVHYGGASGAYTNEIYAGNATNATISGLVEGTTYYFAATTYAASGMESPFSSEVSYLVPMNAPIVNHPPTLNTINDVAMNENAGLQTVPLSGITSGAADKNQVLTVTAVSSNTGLIPNPTVNYTTANTTGNLTFTPAANASGTATVTVVVHDNGGSANGGVDSVTNTFTVTVNAVNTSSTNQPPTLDPISNLTTNENAGLQTVGLCGITSGAANENNQTLTVTATSGNKGLIPNPTVNYTTANTTGNLTFTPAANASGAATVTVVVHDNGGTANGGVDSVTNTFTVTVNAVNQAPTLNTISNLTTNENAGLQTVNLSGITSGAANENNQTLTVTATSGNKGLIPNPTVNYTTANTTGNLTFTPAANASGTATVTVVVHDNGGSANGGVDSVTNTFTVTVNAVNTSSTNQPPTLDPLNNLIIYENAKQQKVYLSGISAGTANKKQKLKVTAVSDNPGLIHKLKISYASPRTTGLLIFTPVVNTTGTAAITVTVNNGGASNNIVTQTFTVTVIAPPLPTFDAINDITVSENAALQAITVTGISGVATNEKPKLKLTVKSSNPSLVHKPSVKYLNPATTATLSFKPARKMTGTTIITVTLVDRARKINNTFTRTFMITVLSTNVATPAVASRTVTDSTNSAPADLTGELVQKTGTTNMITVLSTNVATPAVASRTVTDSTNSAPADLTGELVPVTLESLGYVNGQYALTVEGAPGYSPAVPRPTCVIEASTDLVNWVPVATNTVPFTFVDPDAGQYSQRFYRSVYAP